MSIAVLRLLDRTGAAGWSCRTAELVERDPQDREIGERGTFSCCCWISCVGAHHGSSLSAILPTHDNTGGKKGALARRQMGSRGSAGDPVTTGEVSQRKENPRAEREIERSWLMVPQGRRRGEGWRLLSSACIVVAEKSSPRTRHRRSEEWGTGLPAAAVGVLQRKGKGKGNAGSPLVGREKKRWGKDNLRLLLYPSERERGR